MVGALTAAALTAGWCALLPFLGPRLGFVDLPEEGELKVHSRPAVPLAGPGLLLGMVVAQLMVGALPAAETAALAVLTGLGVVDDRWQLPPVLRIGVEAGAALLLASRWWEVSPALALMGAALVVVAVNAVNLYDGIDTLAGGTGLVGLAVIAAVAAMTGRPFWLPLLLAAALAGFLPFNLPPARVFLGDGGAYLVGAVTAVGLWDVGIGGGWWGAVAALGLLGMFGIDLVVTVLRRFRSRRPLFVGDRSHLYDVMITRGLGVRAVAGRLVGAHLLVVAVVGAALVYLPPVAALAMSLLVGGISIAAGAAVVGAIRAGRSGTGAL